MAIWVLPGLRTPFVKSDGAFKSLDAIALSVPVVKAMMAQIEGREPDFAVWGTVVPNLTWSNVAREVFLDAGLGSTVPAFSTIMACSTSMMGAIEAAGMLDDRGRSLALVGGTESLSRIQIGLRQNTSDWLRSVIQSKTIGSRMRTLASVRPSTLGLYVPSVANRTTGKSMGEHMELTIKQLGGPSRAAQDGLSLASHRNAVEASRRGFFDDLTVPLLGVKRDTIPRANTSYEKLAALLPAFDRGGTGSITAGNSSPLTDGAAAVWIATDAGLARLPSSLPRVRFVDFEIAAVDIARQGLLMAPAYAIPKLLARNNLNYAGIALWEIHEAFAAQVLAHLQVLEKNGDEIPRNRINPNGGSIALGHPFGATGARILSQAAKELAAMGAGARAIVSICADGGEGSVALLEAA
ncbi:MAG TPA: acetyl-CoA C-acyltransferase [Candidatus Baltobacteraceae bacterium]|nr:acetyl-CoA C-acyltransferase [Candidatus Baltobacteraceae bacterium]